MVDVNKSILGSQMTTQPLLRPQVFEFEPIGGHGGMEYFDLSFFEAISRHNIDVTWVTCDETRFAVDGYELWTPFHNIYGKDPVWRRGARYARGWVSLLGRAFKEKLRRPILIHQQFVTVPFLEFGFIAAARRMGIPCVLSPHETSMYVDATRSAWLLPHLFRQYDALIVHSEASQTTLQQMLGKSAPPIYHIKLGHLNNSHGDQSTLSQEDARRHLGFADGRPIVLFFGNIRPAKGLDYLIRAFPKVLERFPDALLVIAGKPHHTDASTYESLIDALNLRSSVRLFWNYIPDQEIPFYYRASDVVALPYTECSQSAVCLTAYSFHCPVVASAIGGLKEQVVDGETGYLVPPADPQALASALVKMLGDRNKAAAMGQQGNRWASKTGDWSKIAIQTLQVYTTVWHRRKR